MLSGDCNSSVNGELRLMLSLPVGMIIFDVGCRDNSIFKAYAGEVHYFDPVSGFIDKLVEQPTSNTACFFNEIGLSDKEETIAYFPRYESFFNRTASCGGDDSSNAIKLKVTRADKYLEGKNIRIGFLKIDTEGYEYGVLKGFGEKLKLVDRVQFEYGGTYIDSGIKLVEVIDYLKSFGFTSFSYICPQSLLPLVDFKDHYQYSNIYCERI